jgi:hypothetical protein
MGAMEFQWQRVPSGLLAAVDPDAQSGLPEAESLRDSWASVRDTWLLADPDRTARFAALLDALEVGRTAREKATNDVEFLQLVRNSAGLRHALTRYVIAVGSPPGPSDDPAETAAVPDRLAPEAPGQPETQASIPGPDFAPQSASDFSRLGGINDLQWGLWTLQLFNAVGRLLPGESIIVKSLVQEVANDGQSQGSLGVSIAHGAGDILLLVAAPEYLLPLGITYDPLWPALSDIGWQRGEAGEVFLQLEWPEGADEAAALVAHTMRSVFLIDSAARIEQSDEIRPPEGKLPAPPSPGDIVRPEGTQELLGVVGSVIRAVGGTVLTGADATTHGFRIGPWAGWLHADSDAPILDVVVIVTDLGKPAGQVFDTERVLQLQASGFRFGRLVLTDSQALVAASMPCHAFTGQSVEAFLVGLLEDAGRALGLAQPLTPATPGLGGYL